MKFKSFLCSDDDDPLKSGGAAKDNHQRYINTLLRLLEKQQNLDNDVSMIFPNERFDESPKSALYYYVTISMFLQDKELDDSLSFMLYEKCCKSDVNFYGSTICTRNDDSMARKRNTVKKVKFHSWVSWIIICNGRRWQLQSPRSFVVLGWQT